MARLLEHTDFTLEHEDNRIRLKTDLAKEALFLMYPINEIRKPTSPKPWPFNQGYLSLVGQYGANNDLVINLPDKSAMEWLPSILQSYLSQAEIEK